LMASTVEVGDETYRVVHPASVDDLLDEEDFEHDEWLPYWAEVWPSAVALAYSLAREDLVGLRAIELGCGVGLPTIAALDRGAMVLATDHARLRCLQRQRGAGTGAGDRAARLVLAEARRPRPLRPGLRRRRALRAT
jgi:predicted nicotinamide N-methyase